MNELQLIYDIATNLSDYLICIGILTFLWLVGMDDGLRERSTGMSGNNQNDDDLKQRLREYELDSEAWLAADRIEQLEKERDELKQTCVDHAEIQQALLAERDELLADALRYRAIKQWHKAYRVGGIPGGGNIHLLTSTRWPEQLDAAIDEAIEKGGDK